MRKLGWVHQIPSFSGPQPLHARELPGALWHSDPPADCEGIRTPSRPPGRDAPSRRPLRSSPRRNLRRLRPDQPNPSVANRRMMQMKAAVIYENGDPGVLLYEEVPDPPCPDGCVVV